METKDHAYFKQLAKQLMFDLSDKEIEELQAEFEILEEQIKMLERIDTNGVEAMVYPFEQETQFLREDVVDHTISRDEALQNAKSVMAGHVHVPKVVK